MEQIVTGVINNATPETIMLVEYSDVYTAGTGARPHELLNQGNIPVIYTGRGGKFTYHGKGQRVIYPILNLASRARSKDLRLYIQNLEQWIIATLLHFGIKAHTIGGRVGIWVSLPAGDAKIAAIGVRVRKWVTFHGVAVNLFPDLTKFQGIIPCGIENACVTSLKELGVSIAIEEFDQKLKEQFGRWFGD
jgi:lipoyl(octanoyl) transferase